MPLTCLLPLQKKISATKDSPCLQLTTRSVRPGMWYYNDLFGSFGESAENGVPQGQTPPGHRQGDATCPLESTKRVRQRKGAGHKSRSGLANVMLVSLCYMLSGGILLKGNLEKQEHQRREGETKAITFMLESAESSLRPLLCDTHQVVGYTEHCLLTMTLHWDLRGSSILQDQTSML